MTAITASAPPRTTVRSVSLPRLVVSESIKFRTLRSTYWILVITLVAWLGFAAIFASDAGNYQDPANVNAMSVATTPIVIAQLVLGVLGTMFITSEYGTGMIRSTMTAEPRRTPALIAKAIVLAITGFATGIVATLLSWLLGSAILPAGVDTSLSAPYAPQILLGAGLYCTVVVLLCFGIGLIVRNTAGAISVSMALLFVIPMLQGLLPGGILETVGPFLPTNAGQTILDEPRTDFTAMGFTYLSPWLGIAVFAAYAVIATGVGLVLAKRKDV